MGRWAWPLLLTLFVAAAAPALAGHERTLRLRYDTSLPGPFLATSVALPGVDEVRSVNAGGDAIRLGPAETSIEVFVLDGMRWKAPARITFFGGAGGSIGGADFCFHTVRAIPPGAAEAVILASPFLEPCPLEGLNYGPATAGEFEVVVR